MEVVTDLLRIVHLSPGGRPIVDLDLIQAGIYNRDRDTFDITAAERRPRLVTSPRRYAGDRIVGESHGNGTVAMTLWVQGATVDAALAAASALQVQCEVATPGSLIEFAPSGAELPVYFEVRGPAAGRAKFQPRIWEQARFWAFEVAWPVAPLVRWASMDIGDPFDVDSLSDYAQDA